MTTFLLRFMFDDERRLGPGKVALLEAIASTGSISAAAREIGMSYRRAWLLLDALNEMFADPVAETIQGGKQGGGAKLTPLGRQIVTRYRAMETSVRTATLADVTFLERHLRKGAR